MPQSEETPVTDTTPVDSAFQLGLQSPDPDSTQNPDLSPTLYDINHSAVETVNEESNLEHQLQNLDLKEEEEGKEKEKEEEEADKKEGERESDNHADGNDAGYEEDDVEEEERNDNEIDGENVKKNEGKRSHYPVRLEAEDCSYYMKTRVCKFGSNCKFNHPVRRKNQPVKERVKEKDEITEKPSQTECKFAHRDCIQRWCNEKGNPTCEICLQEDNF